MSFCDVAPLMNKGWSEVLTTEDAPPLREAHASEGNAADLKTAWGKQRGVNNGSLWRAVVEFVHWELIIGGTLSAMNGACSTLARPLVLKAFVREVMNRDGATDGVWLIFLFGVVVGVEMCCQALCRHIIGCDAAYRFHGAMSSILLEKVLRGNSKNDSMAFSLLGNDVTKIVEELKPAAMLPSSVVGVVTGCLVLMLTLGMAGMAGIGVLLICLLINVWLAEQIKVAEKEVLEATDDRMSVVHVLLDTFKGMKLFAWESNFLQAWSIL